jgi:chitin synthase
VGSGKSEMKRLAIRAISEISAASPGKKGSKVSGQIANAEVSNAVRIELTHS